MVFKSKLGITCIILTYVAILIEIGGVLIVESESNYFLKVNKFLFFCQCILAIISHLLSIITKPGIVNHFNNLHIIENYLNKHEPFFKNANILNSNFKDLFSKEVLGKNGEEESDTNSLDDESDKFFKYNKNSYINNGAIEEISSHCGIILSRCKKCYIVKIPRVHHCSICKSL